MAGVDTKAPCTVVATAGFVKMEGSPRLAVDSAVRRRNCLRLDLVFIFTGLSLHPNLTFDRIAFFQLSLEILYFFNKSALSG